MVWWMQYQIFVPILLLQFLQLFWYMLMWRIAYRYVNLFRGHWSFSLTVISSHSALFSNAEMTDSRSDDEDDDEEPEKEVVRDAAVDEKREVSKH